MTSIDGSFTVHFVGPIFALRRTVAKLSDWNILITTLACEHSLVLGLFAEHFVFTVGTLAFSITTLIGRNAFTTLRTVEQTVAANFAVSFVGAIAALSYSIASSPYIYALLGHNASKLISCAESSSFNTTALNVVVVVAVLCTENVINKPLKARTVL
ncbi:unnamed protein product [Haemonchus placei]|uniref:7TM_GPCR_Srx domain-containing protein n=1 Tax=Haemonchus placei TaxID=6290 RepID=A0A0N4X1A7_HAEPC|nr:unnamed protein product [Haemonchus placei]